MLEAAGRRRPQPLTDAPLTDVERRSQQAFADPQQTMLSQYYKSMDSAMNDVMKIINETITEDKLKANILQPMRHRQQIDDHREVPQIHHRPFLLL